MLPRNAAQSKGAHACSRARSQNSRATLARQNESAAPRTGLAMGGNNWVPAFAARLTALRAVRGASCGAGLLAIELTL